MAVRSPEQLRREQARLLEEYRAAHSRTGVVAESEAATDGRLRMGRITAVVTSDPTYGPHLVVKPQTFAGRPPIASDSSRPTRRVYPTPNLAVEDYQIDEYVALWIARGAQFAVKL